MGKLSSLRILYWQLPGYSTVSNVGLVPAVWSHHDFRLFHARLRICGVVPATPAGRYHPISQVYLQRPDVGIMHQHRVLSRLEGIHMLVGI